MVGVVVDVVGVVEFDIDDPAPRGPGAADTAAAAAMTTPTRQLMAMISYFMVVSRSR